MANTEKKPSARELSAFCSEVAMMLSAGLPLYDGMEALAETYKDTAYAEMYARVSRGVIETGSLYAALKDDSRWPAYLVEMSGIGERTGRLEEVMRGMSAYYEREGRVRSAVRSAVTYPVVLGLIMILIVAVMLFRVVPVFRRVLGGMGVAMNASGQTLSHIGTVLGWGVLVLTGFVLIAVFVTVLLLRTAKREAVLKFLRDSFPPVRRISSKLASSRVADVLAMMLSGGFPLDEALALVPTVLSDTLAIAEVNALREKLAAGGAFADAIGESKLFDEMYSRMIRMGITTGREDEVMAKVASVYAEQVEESIASLVAIIEPTLVAALSIVIGAILLSVMLPMAGIISSIL